MLGDTMKGKRAILVMCLCLFLLSSTIVVAESDNEEQGFFARLRALLGFENVQTQKEGSPEFQVEPEHREKQYGDSPDETPVDSVPGGSVDGMGGSEDSMEVHPETIPPKDYCSQCRAVICEDDGDEFICPNHIKTCKKLYEDCRQLSCKEKPGCKLGDKMLEFGEKFNDGCNDCTCDEDGSITCTDRECPQPECRNDRDCPVITCITAPCPQLVCEKGRCVSESSCGNGICESQEKQCITECSLCEEDSDDCVSTCTEHCEYTCPKDCNYQEPVCGNNLCEDGEKSWCPSNDCKYGEDCPALAAPCYMGSCPKDCDEMGCADEWNPVCGRPPMPECDNLYGCAQVMPEKVTYSNKCHMETSGAEFLYEGVCESDGEDHALCNYEGELYNPGESFHANDGCNSCSCGSDGHVMCTMMACPEPSGIVPDSYR